ncbi:MAG: glycoside hydrolase family 5 protein, partial [Clostridiales bacterium]|nr:glycoside hydrolase family 5 protein [Clostridiales bacterium]
TGCNWFGYNTGSNVFDGVWACNMREALESIADHGFNLLRIPMSAELLLQWSNGEYPEANYNHAYNPELESMNSLEIFDYALDILAANGVKVMIDIHSLPTDAMGHNLPLWYTDSMTVDDFYAALDWLSARYANNDTIIAYDLKNEPHGKASEPDHAIWNDSEDANNWRYVAQTAGNIILDNNPHALIVIEGIQIYPIDPVTNNFTSTDDDDYYNSWWGGNLRAVADYPIDFGSSERNAQVVYSPHDYGPAVYAQPWFEGGFTYESLYEDYWHEAWLYIDEEQIAPLLIGEWGGFMSGDNLTWMTYMRQLIAEYHLNHTFWCFNANSGDTGGLVLDDFVTWDQEKYEFVREVLWQDADGNFIGLDHVIALGDNGICLSDFSGLSAVPVVNSGAAASSASGEGTVVTDASGNVVVSETTVATGDTVKTTLSNVLKIVIGAAAALVVVVGGVAVYALGKKSVRKD